MNDKINLINQEFVDVGNIHFENEDYNNAGYNYQLALVELRKFDSDIINPIQLKAILEEKIQLCKDKTRKTFFNNKSYIKPVREYVLSKSTFIRGIQCTKSLYLNTKSPNLRTPYSKETKERFILGRDFEKKFKDTFKKGIDLKEILGNEIDKYQNLTEKIIEENIEVVIFEAGIINDEVLVLTDVLVKNSDRSYSIFEVKLSRELNNTIFSDLSVQYFVCKQKLKNIREFNLVLRTADDNFNIINLTSQLEDKIPFVEQNITKFKQILKLSSEPEIKVGSHCDYPYKCDFKEYCYNSVNKLQ